jgi:hypothetical protein
VPIGNGGFAERLLAFLDLHAAVAREAVDRRRRNRVEETHAIRAAAHLDEALGLVLIADDDCVWLACRVQALSFVCPERSDGLFGMVEPAS